MIHRFLIVWFMLLVLGAGYATAQSFTVTNRNFSGSDKLTLDQTTTVTFTVSATSAGSLSLVPELSVSQSEPSSVRNAISTTWTGTQPITGWTSGTRNVTFQIHAFNHPEICSRSISFDLRFFHNQASTPASGGSFLDIDSTAGDQVTLTHQLSERNFVPAFGSSGPSSAFPVAVNSAPFSVTANTRVYFYIFHQINGNPPPHPDDYYHTLRYPLSGTCDLDVLEDNVFTNSSTTMVSGPVIDESQGAPVSMDRDQLGEGVNLFDITDIALSACSNANPPDVVGNQSVQFMDIGVTSNISQVFTLRIYLGEAESCSAGDFSFGVAPSASEFFIDQFFLSSIGEVGALLRVPNTWGSGTLLNNEYRANWYLRRDDHIIELATNTRELALNTNTTSNLEIDNPEDWYLEARITRLDTGAWTSTNSRDYNHELSYEVLDALVEYERSEQNFGTGQPDPDDFFDPGEIINVPVEITDPNNGVLTASELSIGYVVDRNGNNQIDLTVDEFVTGELADPTTVNMRILSPGTEATTDTFFLPYELLYAPIDVTVWFFVDSPGNHSGVPATSSTFRKYIGTTEVTANLNTDDTEVIEIFDFTQNSGGWTSENQSPGFGWQYIGSSGAGRWEANGGNLPQHADDLNSLISPWFQVGRTSRLIFDHDPDFTFNQSGGILEYSFDGNNWQNIGQGCTSCNVQYDPVDFPENIVAYFAGEPVWMGTPPNGNNLHEEDFFIPDSVFSGQSQVRFRFLFQDPSLNPVPTESTGPTHWEIFDFRWSSFQFLADNVFGVDLDQLSYDNCDGIPGLVFESPPVSVSQLSFEWYENIDDLYDGISIPGDQTMPFTPATDDELYFVRVKFDHGTTGTVTERIFALEVTNWINCGPSCLTPSDAIQAVLQDASNSWPGTKTIMDCVEIISDICDPQ